MSFEVESKFRTTGHTELCKRLVELGAIPEAEFTHEDVYLNHPSRDFAKTNEAFRIRRIGPANRITYKGPKRSGPTKTREEIEITFTEGNQAFEQMLTLLNNLGFQKVAVVRKVRRPFHLTFQGLDMEVVLDTAEDLGEFVEVEAIAETEDDVSAAQSAVVALADELRLTEPEPRSYLRMLLEATKSGNTNQTHVPPTD